MKKLLLAAVAVMMTVLSANAQVKIESPHPDLDVKVTRCAYASGTVVIDMLITNFGAEEKVAFRGSDYDSTAYDDEGNQYNKINSKISIGLASQTLSNKMVILPLPQDIPLKFRMQITNVSEAATKFPLVKICTSSKGALDLNVEKPIVIRNLEWVK